MKTTLEIPDDLFRRSKATAALKGESLKDFVTEALEAHLERKAGDSTQKGWRSVFGKARPEEIDSIDATIADEFERIEPETWR